MCRWVIVPQCTDNREKWITCIDMHWAPVSVGYYSQVRGVSYVHWYECIPILTPKSGLFKTTPQIVTPSSDLPTTPKIGHRLNEHDYCVVPFTHTPTHTHGQNYKLARFAIKNLKMLHEYQGKMKNIATTNPLLTHHLLLPTCSSQWCVILQKCSTILGPKGAVRLLQSLRSPHTPKCAPNVR